MLASDVGTQVTMVSACKSLVRHFVLCIWRGGAAFEECGSVWPSDFGVMSGQAAWWVKRTYFLRL